MCRYDYMDGVLRDDEEAIRREEEEQRQEEQRQRQEEAQCWYEEQECFESDHDYTFYQDLNREFNGNYQQVVDESARVWKEYAHLGQTNQDDIYEKLNQAMSDKFYIYKQLRNDMYNNEDRIMTMFDSSFDVCRVVYLSKIISRPDDDGAVERLKQFERWADEELDNCW